MSVPSLVSFFRRSKKKDASYDNSKSCITCPKTKNKKNHRFAKQKKKGSNASRLNAEKAKWNYWENNGSTIPDKTSRKLTPICEGSKSDLSLELFRMELEVIRETSGRSFELELGCISRRQSDIPDDRKPEILFHTDEKYVFESSSDDSDDGGGDDGGDDGKGYLNLNHKSSFYYDVENLLLVDRQVSSIDSQKQFELVHQVAKAPCSKNAVASIQPFPLKDNIHSTKQHSHGSLNISSVSKAWNISHNDANELIQNVERAYSQKESKQTSATSEVTSLSHSPTQPNSKHSPNKKNGSEYTTKKHDTIDIVARRWRISIQDAAELVQNVEEANPNTNWETLG